MFHYMFPRARICYSIVTFKSPVGMSGISSMYYFYYSDLEDPGHE